MAAIRTQLVVEGVNNAQKAFNEASSQLFGLQSAAKKAGAAIAGALSVGVVAAWVRESITAADSARKLAQQAGLTTEAFTGLQWAASQSGVGANELTAAFGRLSRATASAAAGTGKSAETFMRMGVAIRDSEGDLRSGDELLRDLADRFQAMPDGAEKSAAAMELFGRAGLQLIPMLNGGAEGLDALVAQAERLGLVLSDEQAAASEQFNDTISALGAVSQGAANTVSGELLPTLNTMAGLLLELSEGGETASLMASVLSGLLKGLAIAAVLAGSHLKLMGSGLGAIAAAATLLVQGDLKGAAQVVKDFGADAAKTMKQTMETIGKIADGSYEQAGQAAAEGRRNLKAIQDQMVRDAEQSTRDMSKAQKDLVTSSKASLAELVRAEKSAQSEIEKIRQDRLTIEQRYAEAIAKFRGGGGQSGASFGQYQDLKLAAESALRAGDTEGAQRQAQAALKVLEDLQAAGENTYGFDGLAKGLQSIEMAAKDIEQTRAEDKIKSLGAEIQALEAQIEGVSKVDVTLTMDEASKAKLLTDMQALAKTIGQQFVFTPTVTGIAAGGGEQIPGHATGGYIRGPGTGTSDSILARLSNGEFVMRAAAVQAYGPDFMAKLNGLQIPKFAEGGLIETASSIQPLSALDALKNFGTATLRDGNSEYEVLMRQDSFEKLLNRTANKFGRTHK